MASDPVAELRQEEKHPADALQLVGSLTLQQIFGGVSTFWRNHKFVATLVYGGLLTAVGALGYGTVTYYVLKNEAAQYRQIRDEYLQLRKENDELRAKDVYYETIRALASRIEERSLSIAYAISSIMFGTTDIHDPQVVRKDELAWEVLNEFADFMLDFRQLLERVNLATKRGDARINIKEAAHYLILRGKYYQALTKRQDIRGALARDSLLREVVRYEENFADKKQFSEFVRGIYERDLVMPPSLERAERHFDNAIKATPKGEFWPAPQYAKLGIYEERNDRAAFRKQAEQVKTLFEAAREIRHPLYLSSLMSLVEVYVSEEGAGSKKAKGALAEFRKTWNELKGQKGFERYRSWGGGVGLLEKGLEVVDRINSGKVRDTAIELAVFDGKLQGVEYVEAEYFHSFLAMVSHYAHAALLADQRKVEEARERFAKVQAVTESGIAGSPAFLVRWIKALAASKRDALGDRLKASPVPDRSRP